MNLFGYINAFLLAFFVSLIAVPLLRSWATRVGQLDVPDTRKIHEKAVPRLGGVAIVISFLFSVLIFLEINREIRGLLLGLIIIFIIGLMDDLIGLSARQKFVGQITAAFLTIAISGLYIENLGDLFGFGPIYLPFWPAVLFTVFAVVGVTNAINMIDGLDGLSGGISIIALGAFILIFLAAGNTLGMILCTVLAGATVGFLKHNSYPARIFMGDAGSLSLGFILSFLAISLTQGETAAASPAVPVLILGLPIADTLKVMTRRVFNHKSPFTPDMTHVHHSFLGLGLGHRFTVLLIYSWSFVWCFFAIFFKEGPGYFLLGVYLLALTTLYQCLRFAKKNPGRFSWLKNDSSQSFRQSEPFVYLHKLAEKVTPALAVLVIFYMVLASQVAYRLDSRFAYLLLVVFVCGLILVSFQRERRIRYEFIYYAAAALVVVLLTERSVHLMIVSNLDYHWLSNALFAILAALVVLKIVFRREDVVYLTSPLDYLFLAMIIALVLVPGETVIVHRIPSSVLKTIFFILSLKILIVQSRNYRRIAFWGLQLTLIVIFFKSIY